MLVNFPTNVDPAQELTAEDIFASDDLTVVPCQIPEWQKNDRPGLLYFKVMSAKASINFQNQMRVNDSIRREVIVRMLAECACSSTGERLFKTPQDIERLRDKSTAVFLRMQKFLLQLNGMMAPEKSWTTVQEILAECGIESNVVALVKQKWDADDNKVMTDAVKND
jgi:hypothetical protein